MKNIDKYVSLICDFLRLPEADVKSKRRYHELCEARQLISYILKLHTHISLWEIARLLNYRDHASPWRDIKLVSDFLEIDRRYRERVTPLLKAAEALTARLNRDEAKVNSGNPPEPGDICWFWNDFFQNFPMLGTFLRLDQNGDECRYISAEEPEIGYAHCEFAGEQIIPDDFIKRTVNQENDELTIFKKCRLFTSPAMAKTLG